MARILILQNDEDVPPGYLAAACERAGIEYHIARLWAGEDIPADGSWAGVASLGGHMGAYDEDDFPYLVTEKDYLRAAVGAGVPTLGLCLGSQLLADALGGKAFPADRPEVGFVSTRLTDAGRDDPVVQHLDGPVLVFHQDTWHLPPGARLLAETAAYPQAFRLGSGVGIQPHPETMPDILEMWVEDAGARRIAAAAGTDPDALAARYRSAGAGTAAMAERFFTAWLDEAMAHSGAAAG